MRSKLFKSFLLIQGLQSVTSLVALTALALSLPQSEFGILTIALAIQWLSLGAYDAIFLTPATISWVKQKNKIDFSKYIIRLEKKTLTIKYGSAILPSLIFFLVTPFFGIKHDALAICLITAVSSFAIISREQTRVKFIYSNQISAAAKIEILNTIIFFVALLAFIATKSTKAHIAILIWTTPLLVNLLNFDRHTNTHNSRHKIGYIWFRANFNSLLAAKVTWAQSQGYIFLCAALLGTQILGLISSVRILFSPLQTLYSSAAKSILPEMARLAHDHQHAQAMRLLKRACIIYGFVVFAWTVLAIIFLEVISANFNLFTKYEIPTSTVIMWSIAFLAGGIRFFYTTLLKSYSDFKYLVNQGIYATVILLILAYPLTKTFGGNGAICMLIATELFAIILSYIRLQKLQSQP